MKNLHKFLSVAATLAALLPACAFAQVTFSGNNSDGFGGPLGKSTLTVSDNAPGVISFSLALGNGNQSFDNIAFYLSTGSTGGVSNTSSLTDYGLPSNIDAGRESISGNSPETGQSLVNFATGFSAKYAVAIDSVGNANLFQIVPGQSYLNYVAAANYSHVAGSNVYGFSINESDIGLTAGTGAAVSFVATLSHANNDNNGGFYRSNETIGASNVDADAQGNLATNGTLTYSGFDTYITAVPEPATWLAGGLLVVIGGLTVARSRRSVA